MTIPRKPGHRPQLVVYSLVVCSVVVLIVNLLIAGKLFSQEYSDYLSSNEGTFIAIARQIAQRPGDISWWPIWDCGLPFQNTYLPLLHLIVGAWSALTGQSAALSFHQVCAAFYCAGPVAVLFLAYAMTRQPGTSFFAAMAYSIVSPSAILIPAIRHDIGGFLRLRRLHVLVGYGEGPPTASLTFLALAILFLYLALTRRQVWIKIAAGGFMGMAVLTNAFAGTLLGMAALCLLCSFETRRFARNALMVGTLALLSWGWILPLFPPSVLAAIRANSPTVGGDFHYNPKTWLALGVVSIGFLALLAALRFLRVKAELRFFALFAFITTAIVMLAFFAEIYLLPQPHRYHVAMDMAVCLLAVFAVREGARHLPRNVAAGLLALCAILTVLQARHAIHYARESIHSVAIEKTGLYKVSMWLNDHMGNRRVFVGGAYSFYFNDLSNTPQMTGGHDPMQPNFQMRSAPFQILSGMGAGSDEGNVAALWLRAFGTRAISVPGPTSQEYYKPFANPKKFDGVLPLLWSEGGDSIYGVPVRSDSLAHVVPQSALVHTSPVNGVDIAQVKPYVAALEDPAYPEAQWNWTTWHSGTIHANVQPGQAISLQITWTPGWHASMNGQLQTVRVDGLGMTVIEPNCQGPCTIDVFYDGGTERPVTIAISLAVMLLALGLLARSWPIRYRETKDNGPPAACPLNRQTPRLFPAILRAVLQRFHQNRATRSAPCIQPAVPFRPGAVRHVCSPRFATIYAAPLPNLTTRQCLAALALGLPARSRPIRYRETQDSGPPAVLPANRQTPRLFPADFRRCTPTPHQSGQRGNAWLAPALELSARSWLIRNRETRDSDLPATLPA